MRRREFITLIGGATASWPFVAGAQQQAMPVIGFLNSESPDGYENLLAGFRKGLSETGYLEAHNVAFEFRWAQNQYERLPALAAELVRRPVTLIVAFGASNAPLAAKGATSSIPILFAIGGDPVELGLVAALNRPGGNITGTVQLSRELLVKRHEVLRELIPSAASIGLIVNPNNSSSESNVKDLQVLAKAEGWSLHVLPATNDSGLEAAFSGLLQVKAEGFLLGTDAWWNSKYQEIASLAARHALPVVYQYREFVDAGGLMSYGTNRVEQYRQLGIYAGRILKGERPADLPVQRATKVELILNLKAARALGITFPITLLARADEVIE
jgi:putative tryptophan/tyrosine transport system substrate-binding protein